MAAQLVLSLKLHEMLKVSDTKPKYWIIIIYIKTAWKYGIQYSVKTWENLADKLFTICKWDAPCLYPISFRTSVGCYFWAFPIRKIINWTIRGWSFVDIATGCLYQKMQTQSRECNSVYVYKMDARMNK